MRKLSWFFIFAFMAYACQLQNADETMAPGNMSSGALSITGTPSTPVTKTLFVTPYIIAGENPGGIRTCDEATTASGLYFEQSSGKKDYNEGNFPGDKLIAGPITVTVSEGKFVSWTSTVNVNAAFIVKGSAASNVYFYEGAKGDTGLASPNGADLSNLTICFTPCNEVSGTVYTQECEDQPTGVPGIDVKLTQGENEFFTKTDAAGNYTFPCVGKDPFTVSVEGATPPTINNTFGEGLYISTGNDFYFYYYRISGIVYEEECDQPGLVKAGVEVKLSGDAIASAWTDADGKYTFTGLKAGSYTVTVDGTVESPVSVELPADTDDTCLDNVNFTFKVYWVKGTITEQDCDLPIMAYAGLTVELYKGSLIKTETTNSEGYYAFEDLTVTGPFKIVVKDGETILATREGVNECTVQNFEFITPCPCYKDETAWSAGNRYVSRGSWATYTAYAPNSTVILYAGQTMNAGTVHFSTVSNGKVTITIDLDQGWVFADVMENVKIQDYVTAPNKNPDVGTFFWKGTATSSPFSIEVPANNFYGVHVDLWKIVPCPIE